MHLSLFFQFQSLVDFVLTEVLFLYKPSLEPVPRLSWLHSSQREWEGAQRRAALVSWARARSLGAGAAGGCPRGGSGRGRAAPRGYTGSSCSSRTSRSVGPSRDSRTLCGRFCPWWSSRVPSLHLLKSKSKGRHKISCNFSFTVLSTYQCQL